MSTNNFDEIVRRSLVIRAQYHELEQQHHGSEWTVTEDVLAYLTDAGWWEEISCRSRAVGPKLMLSQNWSINWERISGG